MANNAPPKDKKQSPPEGLSWGDGELRAPRRQSGGTSPDVKGLFTDSVIAKLPVSDLAVEEEPAPAPAQPTGEWKELGARESMPGRLPRPRPAPISATIPSMRPEAPKPQPLRPDALPLPAAAFGAVPAPLGPFNRAVAAPGKPRNAPTGMFSAPQPAGAGRSTTKSIAPRPAPVAPASPVVADVSHIEPSGLELDVPSPPNAPAPANENAEPKPPHAAAAAAQLPKQKREDEDTGSTSDRPRRGDKRSEARRAARRAAAKQLPPPPAPRMPVWDPMRVTLAAFAGVLALCAMTLAAGTFGLIPLPPPAAAMLGLDRAHGSLSNAKPRDKAPNLPMPSEAKQPVPAAPLPPPAAPVAPEPAQPAVSLFEPAPEPEPQWLTVTEPEPAPLAVPELEAAPAPPVAAPEPIAPPSAEPEPQPIAPPQPAAVDPPPAAAEATPQPPAAAPMVAETAEEVAADEESTSQDAAQLVRAARAKLASDPPAAAEMMMRLLKTEHDDHHAMEVLVRAWIAMGRGKDAVGYAEFIVKKRPKRGIYRLLEGDAKQLAGDRAGAVAAWRALLALEPNSPEAKQRLGL